MKILQYLIFLFLPLFGLAQSPQCVNFTNTMYLGDAIAIQGNNVWYSVSGALVKMDKTTGAQTVYRPDNSDMVGLGANTVAISPNGTLWGGGYYGFWSFDGVYFTNYPMTTIGDSIKDVFDIEWDMWGNMYLSVELTAYTTDIITFNGTNIERLYSPTPYNTSNNTQNLMCITDSGHVYFSQSLNCYFYDGSTWKAIPFPTSSHSVLVKNNNQEIYVLPITYNSTNVSIYKLSGLNWTEIPCTWANAPSSPILAVNAVIDNNNNIFIAGTEQSSPIPQMIQISNDTITYSTYTQPANISYSNFRSITIDNSGDIWTIHSSGLPYRWTKEIEILKYNNNQWTSFPYHTDIPLGLWFQIDEFNRKWAVSPDGLSLFKGLSWQKVATPDSLALNHLGYSGFDKNGNIWATMTSYAGGGKIFLNMMGLGISCMLFLQDLLWWLSMT